MNPLSYCVHYVGAIHGEPDPSFGTPFTWHCRAFDKAHAEEKFIESCDGDTDWLIVKIEKVRRND